MRRSCVVVLIVCFAVSICTALECYECIHGKSAAGTYNDNCGEDFKSDGISKVSCAGGCYKIYGKSDEGTGILRGCDENNHNATDACVTGSNAEGEGAACICFSDLCNSGDSVMSSIIVTLVLSVVGVVVMRVF